MIKQGLARRLRFFQRYCSQFSTLAAPPPPQPHPPLLHVLQIILMPFRRDEIWFFFSIRRHNHCSKSSGSTRLLLSHVEHRGKRRVVLLKINLAKCRAKLHGRFHYFQHLLFSYCFVLCVCVRFFSTIFHVRTCVLVYRYLLQYKRLCRFVGTANKMATQPMLRVTIEYTVEKLSYDEGTNFSSMGK